jgi:type IV pilus assembly protein PilO
MRFGARELLFLLVMVGLLGSSWYFVFKKADERIAALNQDTISKQRTLDELREARTRIADMNKKIEEIHQYLQLIESKLPRESETGSILLQIDQQARGRRLLQVDKISSQTTQKAAGYYELPVKIVMKGDFFSFYDFLQQIERLTRITRINQMKLTKINEMDGSMTADMTLSIYFAPNSLPAK